MRDHIQARIVEELLRIAHPRWRRMTEVPVYRPARGRIDVVLHDPQPAEVVATEVHSQVRRLEQQLGWARMKADSLPSADFWRFAGDPTVGQLLVIRSTRATRELARRFDATLRAAYPAVGWRRLSRAGRHRPVAGQRTALGRRDRGRSARP